MDTINLLGKKLTGGEGRDAVHVAVCPVIVDGFLRAGERVKFVPGSTERVTSWNYEGDLIGVIDPFVESYVTTGERCWLFLLPNSITGLRHVWTHPSFPDPAQPPVDNKITEKQFAEHWLRGFADRYQTNYDALVKGAVSGEGVCFGDDLEYGDFRYGSEFWRYINIVSGREFSEEHVENTNFRCAC